MICAASRHLLHGRTVPPTDRFDHAALRYLTKTQAGWSAGKPVNPIAAVAATSSGICENAGCRVDPLQLILLGSRKSVIC
jgi:hypothetical protein